MSFWDDIIIGKGCKGNSAIKVRDMINTPLHISENSVSYWISDAYLDTGLTIFKDTKEGLKLTEMLLDKTIDEEKRDRRISVWMDALVIKRIKPAVLKRKIQNAIEHAFDEGRKSQAALIRQSLMLDDRY
jgi:hypothetical protein